MKSILCVFLLFSSFSYSQDNLKFSTDEFRKLQNRVSNTADPSGKDLYRLSTYFDKGFSPHLKQNPELAENYLKRSAKKNYPRAIYDLAQSYITGKYGNHDKQKAFTMLVRLYRFGYPRAVDFFKNPKNRTYLSKQAKLRDITDDDLLSSSDTPKKFKSPDIHDKISLLINPYKDTRAINHDGAVRKVLVSFHIYNAKDKKVEPEPFCSGIYIGNQKVITAYHCVQNYIKSIDDFVVRFSGKNSPQIIKPIRRLITYIKDNENKNFLDKKYRKNPDKFLSDLAPKDWAIVTLEEEPDGVTPLFKYEDPNKVPGEANIIITGYPIFPKIPSEHPVLWQDSKCPIKQREGHLFYIKCDATEGQSGGAIYYHYNGEYHLIGILISELVQYDTIKDTSFDSKARHTRTEIRDNIFLSIKAFLKF